MNLSLYHEVRRLIAEADACGLLEESDGLTGFSGAKLIGALQRLAALQAAQGACYLEIGVFQGMTLLSVAKALKTSPAYGVDNFAQFDPDQQNIAIINRRRQDLQIENAFLINDDYENALEELGTHIGATKVGLYFVDGPHDYRSQFMCLQLAKPFLSDRAVIVVDDSNYRHVRQANRDFLVTNPEFKLVFESYTACHPLNMPQDQADQARQGWWNGVNILVRDPENLLQPMYPPTLRSRRLYENDHVVHQARFGAIAPAAVRVAAALHPVRPRRLLQELRALRNETYWLPAEFRGAFDTGNTFSEGLPAARYNPTLTE